jgi:hypothetical protein
MRGLYGAQMRRALRWLFEDRTTGRIVVAQWPNVPLWIWIASAVVRRFVPRGWEVAVGGWHADPHSVAVVIGSFALAVWAALEVARGVNPFRRAVGAGVLLSLALQL